MTTDSLLPRAYGVSKIHKTNCPYRLIVSIITSALHQQILYLNKLYKSLPNLPFYIKDSFHLFNMLTGLKLPDNSCLCSLDVVSLFTNVPLELTLKGISKRWKHICLHTKISEQEFLSALKFVLSSTYFTFDNKIYRQTFGTPMGSPLSPIVADITIQDLESLNTLTFHILFYFRYIDDIIVVLPNDKI